MLDDALDYLKKLIAEGVEYPDAEWRAVSKFDLDASEAEELRERYLDD